MINLNPRLKRKILRILKEEYKKSLGEYDVDDVDGDFEDIHNLGDDGLSINKIHLTQIIMELFGADVTAYNYAVKRFIDDSEALERREEEKRKQYE
jgi:hypothetical protein